MTWNDHDHRGEYAAASHTHDSGDLYDVAREHHRHYDLESEITGLRQELGRALERIEALERQTPPAVQARHEAALAAAGLAVSGLRERGEPVAAGRHGPGCQCPHCPGEEGR